MHTSNKALTVGLAGVCLLLLTAFVVLSSVSAALAWMGGTGKGGGLCQPPASVTPVVITPGTSPTVTGSPSCVPPSGYGALVVQWATAMAAALYVNPACGGHISYPNCYYTWYKAPGTQYPPNAPTFPEAVIQYGQQVCPGCYAWANGTYQCVSFVRGAYSQVYPMQITGNAFDLWALYANQPGWMEIPSGAAPPGSRGIPQPGDVIVFKDSGVGHVAIVMSVELPSGSSDGAITFSNANSVSPYTTMPLLPDLSVDTSSWPGYSAWGYLRPHAGPSAFHLHPPSSHPVPFTALTRRKESFFS
jgi:surface antigen